MKTYYSIHDRHKLIKIVGKRWTSYWEFDRPPGHSHIKAETSNSVIHRLRQADITLDLGEDE